MATATDFRDPNRGFWAQRYSAPGFVDKFQYFYNGQFIVSETADGDTRDPWDALQEWVVRYSGDPTKSQYLALWQAEQQAYTQKSDAFNFLEQTFNQYGLGSLVPTIKDMLVAGNTGDTIALLLAETPEYKARFAGNETRRQKGLSVLSPAEYIGMEDQYKNLFRQYGLPENMYDTKEDLAGYIGNDVSAQEMDGRMSMVRKTIRADNTNTRDAYAQWYAAGLTEGDAIAAILDPERALPELERRARSAAIGGAAQWHGFGAPRPGDPTGWVNQGIAEYLGDKGVTEDDANRGFAAMKQFVDPTQTLARRYKQNYSVVDAESEVFFNEAGARKKREDLFNREIAEFSGSQRASSKSFSSKPF